MKTPDLKQYDNLLKTGDWLEQRNQPVSLTLIELLEPSGGKTSIIFPPTYAFKDDAAKRRGSHPYPISNLLKAPDGADTELLSAETAELKGVEANTCDLDTVAAQSNRSEPIFSKKPLNSLVPQIVIKGDTSRVNLLDFGHRVADGAARFSGVFGEESTKAILELANNGNAGPLAKLAPTSLVFGFWDSRGTQFKSPRILASTIRATNVAVVKRSAQYDPPFDIEELAKLGELGASPNDSKEGTEPGAADKKNPLSQQGLLSAPATDTHGGVRVFGKIVRRTEINLIALRSLYISNAEGVDEDESLKMRRYLLGLALVAARSQAGYNLRQGCMLINCEGTAPESNKVFPTGTREAFSWVFEDSVAFAEAAARDFGVFEEQPEVTEYPFQTEKVVAAIKADEAKKAAKEEQKAASKATQEAEKKAKAEAKAARDAEKDAVKASKEAEKKAKAEAKVAMAGEAANKNAEPTAEQ